MRLVELGKNLEDERDTDTQAVAASQMFGSYGDDAAASGVAKGSRIGAIERIEGTGLDEGRDGGIRRRHVTLSTLKRYLWAKNGPAKHIYALLGRD